MALNTFFKESGQFLLDLLYPPRCLNCQTTNAWLCQDCLNKISFIAPPICKHCGMPINRLSACRQCRSNPLQFIDGIRSAAIFEDNPIRPAIHYLKYRNHRAVAAVLGQLLVDTYQKYELDVDVIIPIPLHPSRRKERGFNQSDLLAGELSLELGLPVDTHTLRRVKETQSQMKLGISERRQNVANAFACCDKKLAGRRALLLDDVCTTGSTLDAGAAALIESGVLSVWGLTLARAP